jgi:hypothetical protein
MFPAALSVETGAGLFVDSLSQRENLKVAQGEAQRNLGYLLPSCKAEAKLRSGLSRVPGAKACLEQSRRGSRLETSNANPPRSAFLKSLPRTQWPFPKEGPMGLTRESF